MVKAYIILGVYWSPLTNNWKEDFPCLEESFCYIVYVVQFSYTTQNHLPKGENPYLAVEASLYPLKIKKLPPQMYPQANMTEAISLVRFPLPRGLEFITKISNHKPTQSQLDTQAHNCKDITVPFCLSSGSHINIS